MATLYQFGTLLTDEDGNPFAEIPKGSPVENNLWLNIHDRLALMSYTGNFFNEVFKDKVTENGIHFGVIDHLFLYRLEVLVNWPQPEGLYLTDLKPFLATAKWCAENIEDPYWVAIP